jgi:hypothetical protein
MSLLQRIMTKFLPESAAESMELESRLWRIRCLTCGFCRSIWEVGGIRWGAASKGKRTLVRCPRCNRLRCAAIEREPEPER